MEPKSQKRFTQIYLDGLTPALGESDGKASLPEVTKDNSLHQKQVIVRPKAKSTLVHR